MRVRLATPDDAPAIAAIYNQGIEERSATFETTLRSDEDVLGWFHGAHPIVVVVDDDERIIGFARSSPYSDRECYGGVFEFAVYTDFSQRRRGVGMLAMRELVTQARSAGAWKLVSRIFVDNDPSRMLVAALGFREVGVYQRHAKLDGKWRDVVIVEKFLAPPGAEARSVPPPPSRAPREQAIVSLRSENAAVRLHALESARSLLEVYRKADLELLDGVADAFFASARHDANVRARFVDFFRGYASLSAEAARELDGALFARLARLTMALDVDAFYEAVFVVKQVVGHAGDLARARDLSAYREVLLDWVRQAIDLPRHMRSRISPGNVTSLLMTLALASCENDTQKREIADLAAEAKERHRVEPPASVRPSQPPAPAASPVAEVMPVAEAMPAPPPLPVSPEPSAPEKRPRKKRAPADPSAPKKRRAKRA